MPHFVASELCLHCLHMSSKQVSSLKRVNQFVNTSIYLTLLHSVQPKVHRVSAFLSAIGSRLDFRGRMDDLLFYVLFNSISVTSELWADGNERLHALEPHLRLRRFALQGIQTWDCLISKPALKPLSVDGSGFMHREGAHKHFLYIAMQSGSNFIAFELV